MTVKNSIRNSLKVKQINNIVEIYNGQMQTILQHDFPRSKKINLTFLTIVKCLLKSTEVTIYGKQHKEHKLSVNLVLILLFLQCTLEEESCFLIMDSICDPVFIIQILDSICRFHILGRPIFYRLNRMNIKVQL